jgi:superfamily II DNA or RNA helicase
MAVKDLCGYLDGERLDITLRSVDLDGNSFQLRDYQKDAMGMFYCAGQKTGGSGVIVLPCGSGKTIIGLGTMAQISNHTLIIATNNISVQQWRDGHWRVYRTCQRDQANHDHHIPDADTSSHKGRTVAQPEHLYRA